MFTKKIMLFALPMIVANIIMATTAFAVMWLLSLLGQGGVAAGALTYNTFSVMAALVFSFSVPISIFVARAYGAKKIKSIPAIVQGGALITIALGLVVAIGVSHMQAIYTFFHQPPQAAAISAAYFKGYAFCLIPFGLRYVLLQVMNGTSHPKMATFFSLVGLLCSLPFSYTLALGKFGMPHLGAYGVGLGQAVGNLISLAIVATYLNHSKHYRDLQLFSFKGRAALTWVRNIFSLGIPVSAQRVGEVSSLFAITVIIGHFGQMQLASYQVALQFSFLVIMIGFGFTQASGILVGQSLGAGKTLCATTQGNTSIWLAFLITLAFSAIFVLFPHLLIHVFIHGHTVYAEKVSHLAVIMLAITAISQLFDTVRNVATGALRGYKDTRYPMYLGLLACWVIAVPVGYLLAEVFHLGAKGAVMGFALGVTVGAILIVIRLRKMQKLSHENEGVPAIDR